MLSRPIIHPNMVNTGTLATARSMIQEGTNVGHCRRLNQNERLRVSLGTNVPKKGKKAEQLKGKPFEFTLLNCTREDSDDEEDEILGDK